MFSLRAKTQNVKVWTIDSDTFLQHLRSIGRLDDYKMWHKVQERTMVNKLASNLFNSFRGMNIDGINDWEHERFRNLSLTEPKLFYENRYVAKAPKRVFKPKKMKIYGSNCVSPANQSPQEGT